jgi:hypothetical protein
MTNNAVVYSYDEKRAIEADKFSKYISEGGAYIGKFVTAEDIVSKGGTYGVSFVFESPSDGEAKFSIYTKKSDGTILFGFNLLNSIMFSLGVKSLVSVSERISKYDFTLKRKVDAACSVFKDLQGKEIGIILQEEVYTKQSGKGDGSRVNLVGVFDAKTRLTMSEIKEGKTVPSKVDKTVASLKIKDSREVKSKQAYKDVDPFEPAKFADDDIPFMRGCREGLNDQFFGKYAAYI